MPCLDTRLTSQALAKQLGHQLFGLSHELERATFAPIAAEAEGSVSWADRVTQSADRVVASDAAEASTSVSIAATRGTSRRGDPSGALMV
jgi:hypothetical protein